MSTKQPALLTVLIDTTQRSWYVGGVSLSGEALPLIRSEVGNLDRYVGAPRDEQVDFLRHRLSNVLQLGCDRLWGRQLKPQLIVFITNDDLEPGHPDLTQRVAEHFVLWMTKPAVAFLSSENGFPTSGLPALRQRAGELDPASRDALTIGLPHLIAALADDSRWEMLQRKPERA